MSLKVWLPLNGDLKNLGCSNIVVTNNGATIDNNGKIGKCYSFDGVDDRIYANNVSISNQEMSACCWVKFNNLTNNNYPYIFALGSNVSGTNIQLGLAYWKTDGKLHLVGHGSETASTYTPVLSTWVHLCITIKGNQTLLYVNGVLNSTITNANSPKTQTCLCIGARPNSTAGAGTAISYPMNCCLNDFRIYDHCLSALEVKEISQALILHYKLDDTYFETTENILPQTTIYTTSNSPAWDTSLNGAVMYTPTGWTSGYNGGVSAPTTGYHMRWIFDEHNKLIMYSPNKNSVIGKTGRWMGISSTTINLVTKGFVAGCKYTISWWQKTSNLSFGAHPGLYYKLTSSGSNGFHDGNPRRYNTLLNTWQKMEITFTMSSSFDGTAPNATVYFYGDGSAEGDLYIKDMQLELKDHSTPYIEGGSTRNLGYIIDSSGYGNDGVITGNVTTKKNDSKEGRYDILTYIPLGSTDYITTKNSIGNPSDAITMSIWFKSSNTSPGNSYHEIFNHATSSQYFEFAIQNNGLFRGGMVINGTRYVANTAQLGLLDGNWHMLSMTYNGAIIVRYVDGISRSTTSITGPLTGANGSFLFGHYGPNTSYHAKEAYLADARIYATALSAEDILKLYQTPTEIDKNGSWHTHEFYENGENFITKTGLIKDSASSEYPFTQHLKYDPEIYFEPDGSAWVHIYHHNNPGAGSFASSNTFANSCYIDANRWFNATEICNQLNKWEFLVKYAFTSGGVEYKERWIQTKNPENAAFADVAAANITRITGNGYKTGTWGGLFKQNSGAYWVMNNGVNGNWWGATGSFSVYQSGIPGYGGTVTTTGYNDLYVRIDNIDFDQIDKAWITKSNIYLGNSLIEK